MSKIDQQCINTIMMLSADGVQRANSGHPGMPMGDAAMAYVLWDRFLKHSPKNPAWVNRDRFVLSAGHGSMLLYSLLHLTGHDITMDDIKAFRQWESKTPGHPEYCLPCGIETTTGPLGQGMATGIGMAMAERYLASMFNRPKFKLIDYTIYGILSDGDLMEGLSSEAASLAGHLGLGNIVYLYSDNKISIEGSTDLAFTENVRQRFDAMGWHTETVDGYDLKGIEAAIKSGIKEKNRPTLILARTHIGYMSPAKQDSEEAHGSPLGEAEIRLVKERLGLPPAKAFHIPKEVAAHMKKAVAKGKAEEGKWNALLKLYSRQHPEAARLFTRISRRELPEGLDKAIPVFKPEEGSMATRQASGKVLNAIAGVLPELIGGSADLAPSNNTHLKGYGAFTPGKADRNIHFGVREHTMGTVLNGMALSNMLIPYGGTFLIFTDYLRPASRLSALMGVQAIYVMTHDSVGLGEDGPTHQPVEHLTSYRAMPNMTVIRPCDANETAEAWRFALNHRTGPTILALSRQGLPVLDRQTYAKADGLQKGGYILKDCKGKPQIILISSGSEVPLCLKAADALGADGIGVRVVSMPSTDIFDRQPRAYREGVLPPDVRARLAVEAGASLSWYKYIGDSGDIIGIDRFGASAPAKVVFEKLGFTPENVAARARALLK